MRKRLLVILSLVTSATATAAERVKMSESVLLGIISKNHVTELDQVPALLPPTFNANFTIKHGLMVDGPRGHLAEGDLPGLGQHSEPLAPRAMVFDPFTGFGITYNGSPAQQGGQSLDTISFNFDDKSFRLVKIDFPLSAPGRATTNSQNCALCHGPANRPIFSMYPDWPRFYGSDNDELLLGNLPGQDFTRADAMTLLRREIQMKEFEWFNIFKADVVAKHPRYAPLFAPEAYAVHGFREKNDVYTAYPYRSDVEQPGAHLNASDVSRAFTRRAGLRFNLLYSRLLVQQVVRNITTHPRFEEFGPFFVYNIMRCGPETQSSAVMDAWGERLRAALAQVETAKEISYQVWNPQEAVESKRLVTTGHFALPDGKLSTRSRGRLLHYGQNLALFGLKINDVDMRYTYHHPEYSPDRAFRSLCEEGKDCGDQVMQMGYLQGSYYNSYNDGSTTMDEHLTANLLTELAKNDKRLRDYLNERGAYAIRGLLNKYSGKTFADRLVYDREFFTQMDSYSKWFSLPYPFAKGDVDKPNSFKNLHHRAGFSENYRKSFVGVCGILERKLTSR